MIAALEVVVAAQKRVQSLGAAEHFGIGAPPPVVILVVQPGRIKPGQVRSYRANRVGRFIDPVGRTRKRPAHVHETRKTIGTGQRRPSGHSGSEIVPDQYRPPTTQAVQKGHDVADQVQREIGPKVFAVFGVSRPGAPVAAQVRGYGVVPGRGQRRQNPPP